MIKIKWWFDAGHFLRRLNEVNFMVRKKHKVKIEKRRIEHEHHEKRNRKSPVCKISIL